MRRPPRHEAEEVGAQPRVSFAALEAQLVEAKRLAAEAAKLIEATAEEAAA
jgi:hypothetical protein